jgi:hypothetical protein
MKTHLVLTFVILILACEEPSVLDETLPESRPFYMGFTAFPYELSLESLNETYANVAEDGDILLTHLDAGVPWDEALSGDDFPSEITNTLQRALDELGPTQKLFLTATPTAQTRNTLALYWNNNGEHQELPEKWREKRFNDTEVVTAYINYCKRIIDFTNPDYFAFSIESNNSFVKGSQNFADFLELAAEVYGELKEAYASLPIMLTLQSNSFEISRGDMLSNSRELLAFSDYVAMSTYPYLTSSDLQRDANPALFADNWLKEFRDLASEKPFAISETAFIAEDLELESVDIKAKGSEEWQKDYLQKLMLHANDLEAEFVIWFIYRDYDAIYNLAPSDVFRIWRDTGLKDEDGRERESYDLWLEWLNVRRG